MVLSFLWRIRRLALILLHAADMNPRRIVTIKRAALSMPLSGWNSLKKLRIGVTDECDFLVTKKIAA
jgi:hypothetical protein